MEVTIDDLSPEISWTGNWNATANVDSNTGMYHMGTRHLCEEAGAGATLRFTGSEVRIQGAGAGDGLVAKVDGTDITESGSDEVDSFTVTKLDPGTHDLSISCKTIGAEIDFITTTTPVETAIQSTIHDDRDPAFVYTGTWTPLYDITNPIYYNNTWQVTKEAAGIATFKFVGISAQVFGSVYTDHGGYSVSVDGGEARSYQKDPRFYVGRLSLFSVTGLEQGEHSIVLSNQPSANRTTLSIDYAIVNSTAPDDPATAIATASAEISTSPSASSDTSQSVSTSSTEQETSESDRIIPVTSLTTMPAATLSDSLVMTGVTPSTSAGTLPAVSQSDDKPKAISGQLIIAGSVIGGIILLVGLLYATRVYFRRRTAREQEALENYAYADTEWSVYPESRSKVPSDVETTEVDGMSESTSWFWRRSGTSDARETAWSTSARD